MILQNFFYGNNIYLTAPPVFNNYNFHFKTEVHYVHNHSTIVSGPVIPVFTILALLLKRKREAKSAIVYPPQLRAEIFCVCALKNF